MNRKLKMLPYTAKVNIGIRGILAVASLFTGQIMLFLFLLFAPIAVPMTFALGLTAEEQATKDKEAFFVEVEGKIKKLIAESQKDDPSVAKVDKLVKELNDKMAKLSETEIKAINDKFEKLSKDYDNVVAENKKFQDALNAQSAAIKKLEDTGAGKVENPEKAKTLKEVLREMIMSKKDTILKEIKDQDTPDGRWSLADYVRENKKTPMFTSKALVDLFISTITTAGVQDLRLTSLDPTRVSIPTYQFAYVMNVFSSKSINRPYMALLVVYEYEDGAGIKAEGAASVKSSFKLKTVKFPAFYIATHYILSDETLDDLDEVLDEIAIVAPDRIQRAVNTQLIRAGGDDVASIQGILNAAKSTPYAIQSDANSIDAAYIVDLIADAALQCRNNGYPANVVMLTPAQILALAAKKNNMNDSLSDRRVTYGVNGVPTYVNGLLISEVKELAADTLVVLDNKQPWIGKRKEITFEIGEIASQFVEGEKTAKISIRIAFGVRDKAGVIYVAAVANGIQALTA